MKIMSNPISWDDQRIFLAVLEEGSLSGAARRLRVSHPTVRARLEGLEAALGTVLFTRSVNGLTPTESAEALREPARTMAMASDLFVRHALSSPGRVAGQVRISVPDFMGIEVMPRMLAELRDQHPDIHIELSLSNAPADLLGQEVDLAVRTVAPKQGALVARKVASIPLGFFASVEYLARRGMPETISDLAGHDLIGPDRNASDLALVERLRAALGDTTFVLRTDSHPAQLAAARAGIGIAMAQVPVGLRDQGLRHVLPDFTAMILDTWIVTHENLSKVPRIRAVSDCLATAFAEAR